MSEAYSQTDLEASSPLAWLTLNRSVTENQKPLEFTQHRFLIDLYADMHDDIVVIKSAQVGESVERIFKALWCANFLDANIIYVLPTKNITDDFVVPKVNPIIAANPHIAKLIKNDSKSLKQVGKRFIYFSGAFSESAAIMKSADILILDELDRMKSQAIVNMFDSRLQASKLGYRWRLSNPSGIGYGVDALWKDSDMRYWFVECSHCHHRAWMDFSREEMYEGKFSHYIDQEKEIYACGNCELEIYDKDRINGEWVTRYPDRHRHGYWISQMMAPWVSARRILEQKEESNIEFFYNFVLGKAYTPSDMIVNRETILRACAPSLIAKTGVAMGVDQDAGGQYYVLMTSEGIFAHGYAKSWEEIEHLKLMYNATMVIDPNPYSTYPKKLAQKYRDVYLCYFKEMKGLEIADWNGSTVYVDRTRIIDLVANEVTNATLMFREHAYQLEDIIAHWNNLYRTTEEKEDGRMRSVWLKKENRQSDYPFAMLYARLALSRSLSGNSSFVEPREKSTTPTTDTINEGGQLQTDLKRIVEESFADME